MDELGFLRPDHLFLRRDALAHGYDDRDLSRGLRAGRLARVRHGAYVDASIWSSADALERHRLRAHAVVHSHSTPLVLSHVSAAVEHGLRLNDPDLRKVHVTCLGRDIAKTTPDIEYHCARATDQHLMETPHGIPLADPVRAALETASATSVANGLVVLDSVVDLGHASVDEVVARWQTFSGPGSRRLQVTVRLVRKGAQSVGESLMRHTFFLTGLPEPRLQFEVRDEHGVLLGVTDFAWPDHHVLGEFDGRTKYGRLRRRGETVEDAVVREKVREDRLREATNWLMIRLIWADLFKPEATARRIRRQLDLGRRLRDAA